VCTALLSGAVCGLRWLADQHRSADNILPIRKMKAISSIEMSCLAVSKKRRSNGNRLKLLETCFIVFKTFLFLLRRSVPTNVKKGMECPVARRSVGYSVSPRGAAVEG
jgi:hypothetical protein